MARQATRKQASRKSVMPSPVPTSSKVDEISKLWQQVSELIDRITAMEKTVSRDAQNDNGKKE